MIDREGCQRWFRSKTGSSLQLASLLVLTALAIGLSIQLDLRPAMTGKARLIGHADQANTAIVARNIVNGRGAVTDVVWLLRELPDDLTDVVHGEDYWSLYTPYFIAPFFAAFGANIVSLLLAASVCKAMLATLCALTLHAVTRSGLTALCGLGIVLFIAPMVRAVNGLSDIYLTLCFSAAGIAFAFGAGGGRRSWFILSGLATGIAIGVKPSGLLMLGIYGFHVIVSRKRAGAVRDVACAGMGMGVGLIPAVLHNWRYFGELGFLPVALGRVSQAHQIEYLTRNHNLAYFSRVPYSFTPEEITRLWWDLPLDYIRSFADAMFLEGEIVPFALLIPFGLSLVIAFAARGFWRGNLDGVSRWLVGVSILVMLAATALSSTLDTQPRYWNFVIPFVMIATLVVCDRISLVLPVICLALVLGGTLTGYKSKRLRRLPAQQIETIRAKVPEDAILYSSNPWEVSFHTGRRSVVLPHTADPEEFWALAKRFGVSHIVIVQRDVRHLGYKALERGEFPDDIEKIIANRRLVIGRLLFPEEPGE